MLLKASIFVLFLEMVCGERVCILSGDQFHSVRTLPECAFLCGIKSGCSVFNLCKSNENNLCVTYERQGDSACLNMSLLLRCLTFIKTENTFHTSSASTSQPTTPMSALMSMSTASGDDITISPSCETHPELCQHVSGRK
ncbi:uncharacterized protein LOC125647767 [Ostrea edulis]|uniref:uncharacterized protein LOC125647767 n=1 Tax=Ostrea edulis TaxID=37623 RepID=UPI0024AF0EB8|nr:uncharacterized protein LOC125647767 [Ostrea edulis]